LRDAIVSDPQVIKAGRSPNRAPPRRRFPCRGEHPGGDFPGASLGMLPEGIESSETNSNRAVGWRQRSWLVQPDGLQDRGTTAPGPWEGGAPGIRRNATQTACGQILIGQIFGPFRPIGEPGERESFPTKPGPVVPTGRSDRRAKQTTAGGALAPQAEAESNHRHCKSGNGGFASAVLQGPGVAGVSLITVSTGVRTSSGTTSCIPCRLPSSLRGVVFPIACAW